MHSLTLEMHKLTPQGYMLSMVLRTRTFQNVMQTEDHYTTSLDMYDDVSANCRSPVKSTKSLLVKTLFLSRSQDFC